MQLKQQSAENGALWHAQRQRHVNRQTTSVEDPSECAREEKDIIH